MAQYQIKRIIPNEEDPENPTYEDIEVFVEAPAPHVTLYGRILSLNYQFPPFQHMYVLLDG